MLSYIFSFLTKARNQLKDALSGWVYSFSVTFVLMLVVDIPIIILKGLDETLKIRDHAVELTRLQSYPLQGYPGAVERSRRDSESVVDGHPPLPQSSVGHTE
jgi:hypothetical protein